MDVITLSKFGYPAVATLGTSVTEDQINNVFNVTDEAFLVFDGDVAGRRAAIRVFEKNLSILKIKKFFKFVFFFFFFFLFFFLVFVYIFFITFLGLYLTLF